MPYPTAHSISLAQPARPARVDVRTALAFLLLSGITVLGPIIGLDLLLVLLLGLLISLILLG